MNNKPKWLEALMSSLSNKNYKEVVEYFYNKSQVKDPDEIVDFINLLNKCHKIPTGTYMGYNDH